MSIAEALRPIHTGNAVSVEARGADCLSAARLALLQLTEVAHPANLTAMSVQVSIINDDKDQPWEAVAFGALLD